MQGMPASALSKRIKHKVELLEKPYLQGLRQVDMILCFLPRHALITFSQCSKTCLAHTRQFILKKQGDLSVGLETQFPVVVSNSIDAEAFPGDFCYLVHSNLPDWKHDMPSSVVPRTLPVQVRKCHPASKGWGVYSMSPIKIGMFIGEYSGRIIRTRDLQGKRCNYVVSVREEGRGGIWRTNIDASWAGNFARFINHSCDPNAELQTYRVRHGSLIPRVHLHAIREIDVSEEITFDYGLKFGTGTTDCLCARANCRGKLPFDLTL